MNDIQVSIIVVSYNTRQLLHECLISILACVTDLSHEVIVVDNQSTDGSVEMVRERYPWVRLIEAGENLGFGKANNLGIEAARGDVFFFMNSDAFLLDNSVKILYDYLQAHPGTGMCGGWVIRNNGRPGESFNHRWTVGREIYSIFLPKFLLQMLNPYFYPVTGQKTREVGNITGADMMVPREVVTATGAFDPDFFMYYEESEWAYRVKKAGYRVTFVPAAHIVHAQGASVRRADQLKKRIYREAWISKFLYFHKVNGPCSPCLLLNVHRVKYLLARLLLFWDAKRTTYWREKWKTVKACYADAQRIIRSHAPKTV